MGDPRAIEAGRELFAGACSACHGINGEGGHGPSLVEGHQVRRSTDQQLFQSIKNGVPGTQMPPYPQADDKVWQVVAFVRSLAAPAIASQVAGDAGMGRDLFFGKAGCSRCHMIGGSGGFLGPDLSDVGATRTLKQLKEGLLKPNARIADGFQAITALTKDGREVRGVARNRSNYSVQVLDAQGRLHLLWMKDLRKLELAPKSLMPDNYDQQLKPEEIDNVIAFLSRQTVRSRSTQ